VNTIKAVVRPAWGNPKGLVVRSLGPNLFLAEFSSELDKNRVAKGGPWCLSKHAILLKDFDVKVQPEDIVFDKLMVWARLMNLGYGLMNDVRGSALASRLGDVDHVEVDENGRAWGSYLRARVNIDPTQPIMRYASAYSKKKDTTVHYEVIYEKLPLFCFSCGLIGHSSVVCPMLADRDAEGKLPYNGDKLCVPERKKRDTGSSSESSRNSWNGTVQGSRNQGQTSMGEGKKGTQGVASSPTYNNPKARKATSNSKTGQTLVENHATKSFLVQENERVIGQKRKQVKQVYRPKTLTLGPSAVLNSSALVLLGDHLNPEMDVLADGEARNEFFDDSNKKQRTNTKRSADPAAADGQPRLTQ
jgi:hypothetical protein